MDYKYVCNYPFADLRMFDTATTLLLGTSNSIAITTPSLRPNPTGAFTQHLFSSLDAGREALVSREEGVEVFSQ